MSEIPGIDDDDAKGEEIHQILIKFAMYLGQPLRQSRSDELNVKTSSKQQYFFSEVKENEVDAVWRMRLYGGVWVVPRNGL